MLSTLLISVSLLVSSINEPKGDFDLLKDARDSYMKGNYSEAKAGYEELIKRNPNSLDYNFELGLSYFQSEVEREKALEYFEKALTLDVKTTIPEIIYYCGLARQYTGNMEMAKSYFEKFKVHIDPKIGVEILNEVNHLIVMCEYAQANTLINDKIEITNLGQSVNSEFGEYAPVMKKDGSMILFTARNRGTTGGKKSADTKFYEDIYVAYLEKGIWIHDKKNDSIFKLTSELNNEWHNAAITYNSDETKLFTYRKGDIYQSEFENGKWGIPVKMEDGLNTREQEPSVFISPDQSYLLIVSTKEGGKGGRDIYSSKKLPDGSWSTTYNLGDAINTPFDDDAPFITNDGKTLYFASKGHSSIGGYDIFKSEMNIETGEWSKPVNIGLPFNSTADDIYYVESMDSKTAFLSSNRAGGFGGMDIYQVLPKREDTTVLITQNQSDLLKTDTINESVNSNAQSQNLVFHPTLIKNNYEQYFGYNLVAADTQNEDYLGFLNQIVLTINQKGIVEIFIEASASYVPTTTFGTNKELANNRANKVKSEIESRLKAAGFSNEKYKITITAKVQGPAYKDDYEKNADAYGKFQYIKLSIR